MKFCKDCNYAVKGYLTHGYFCRANPTYDMVHGTPVALWAREAREDEDLCGRDAKWFVQKTESPAPPPECPPESPPEGPPAPPPESPPESPPECPPAPTTESPPESPPEGPKNILEPSPERLFIQNLRRFFK